MKNDECPKIIFKYGFSERDEFEVPLKGWFTLTVETMPGKRYSINFYDPVRLTQDMQDEVRNGRPCLTEENLVIVPEVTLEAMKESVAYLWRIGAFDYMVPEKALS